MSKKNVSIEGLEINVVETTVPQYDNIEWLSTMTPIFPEEHTSAKCKLEREPKVQNGIERIKEIDPEFPKLLCLLAIWWENKEARKTIKQAIDDEATAKGIDPVQYMQVNLRQFAEKYDGLADAVDRMKYATTYFKPRGGVKDTYKAMRINGEIYNVNLRIFAELKEQYGEDVNKLKEEIIKVSEKQIIDDIL